MDLRSAAVDIDTVYIHGHCVRVRREEASKDYADVVAGEEMGADIPPSFFSCDYNRTVE
jgi:hypothetical protein